jgi:hypothetical protein
MNHKGQPQVHVLSANEALTSVEVRNSFGRTVATLEVYQDGDEVYASTGKQDRRSLSRVAASNEPGEQSEQTRPLHPPTEIVLRVDGPGFPGFPPDTIKVEPQYGTFELLRDGTKLASGALAGTAGVPA